MRWRRVSRRSSAALAALAALVPALAMLGFTVDDALVTARYAHHISTGRGYRFNPEGPVTDGVTPLGFAHLLAPLSSGGVMNALWAAKAIGIVSWLAGAAALGRRVAEIEGSGWKWMGLVLVCASAPLAAWSAAGMETGLVTGIVALAIALRHARAREPLGTVLFGVAAGLRPELLPFAVVAGVPSPRPVPLAQFVPTTGHLGRLALAAAPFALAATIREAIFGRAVPLAAIAKAPDPKHGAIYAAACFLLTGPVALLALSEYRRVSPYARWLAAAVAAHFVAIGAAGGDWMPLSRLAVPALPAVGLVAAELAAVSRLPWTLVRVGAALAGELFAWTAAGPKAAGVLADRTALVAEVAPALASSERIAALDIGWVGAAAPHATIVDLAGITDPMIASLPGGHTTKRIPDGLLDDRGVDTLVLLVAGDAEIAEPWPATAFARGVERWVALEPGRAEAMRVSYVSRGALRYAVVRVRR
jgi:hypothetical protein